MLSAGEGTVASHGRLVCGVDGAWMVGDEGWFVVWIGAWIMMMVDGKYIIMSNFRFGFFVIWRKNDKFALAKFIKLNYQL